MTVQYSNEQTIDGTRIDTITIIRIRDTYARTPPSDRGNQV